MKELYLLRHGKTEANERQVYYGATDSLLTDEGWAQARAVAAALAAQPLELLITSPLTRAKDTAQAIANGRELPVRVDDRIRELDFGDWENKHWTELQNDPLWQVWNEDWEHTAPPHGESFEQLVARVRWFLDDLLKEPSEHVAVVCHQMTLMAMATVLMETEPAKCWHFRFEAGCYSRFTFDGAYAVLQNHNQK